MTALQLREARDDLMMAVVKLKSFAVTRRRCGSVTPRSWQTTCEAIQCSSVLTCDEDSVVALFKALDRLILLLFGRTDTPYNFGKPVAACCN